MYKCHKCNKEFKFESKLNEHKNRKTSCDAPKPDLECNLCNVKFTNPAKKIKHEKTKKHINNITINGDHNTTHVGDINNYLNLTLNINSFKNTDTTRIRKNIIDSIGYHEYNAILDKKYISISEKVKLMFQIILDLLEKLHFSLDLEENHNLKILLIFPGIQKTVYEYLILDINPETKDIIWNSLKYEEMICQILDHLYDLNNNINNDEYDKFILYVKNYLVKNEEYAIELKPYIEEKLGQIYINFNKKQKKDARVVKNTLPEKVMEYKQYRDSETRLNNGFNPNIENSNL